MQYDRDSIRALLDQIGRSDLAEALGVGLTAVSQAPSNNPDGKLPAAWFRTMRALGEKKGVEVPEGIFRWKGAA